MLTLKTWAETNSWTSLFDGTHIDEATQNALFDFFQFRELSDDAKFSVFFARTVAMYAPQYLQLLRVQTTEFDPMIAEYVEHLLKKSFTRDGTHKEHTSQTSSGSNDREQNGTDTTETLQNSTGDTSTGTTEHSSATKQQLTGSTPDSSLYPDTGFPEGLRWQYVSSQQEAKDVADGKSDVLQHEQGQQSDNSNTTTSLKATQTISASEDGMKDFTDKDVYRGEDAERTQGRHEAPQDLLNRARDYIMKTNAFSWFVGRLDSCFYALYD